MSVSVSTTNKPLNPRAQDLSPKGYNRAALYSGKALDFDGVNDSIAGEAPNLPSSDYTICAYFRIDYLSVGGMVTWGDFTTGERRSMLIWDGGHTGNFTLRSSTYGSNPEGSTYLETSKWYFGCVSVASSGEAKIYLNGQLDGSGTNTLNAYTNTDYLIGRTRGGEFFNGALANVRIFNQILTAAQVADLYLNPEKIVPDGVADSALKLWLPMMEGVGTTAYDGSPVGFTEDIVTGFTNGTTYPLDSFVSSGDDITTAIKTSGFGGCVSNGHYYTNGQKVKVKFTYQKNSGNDLRVLFSSLVTGAGTAKSDIQYVSASGEFEHTFTMTADGIAYLQLGTGNASDSIDAVITDVYVSPNVSANHGTINGATWVSGIGAPVAQTALVSWNKGTNIAKSSGDVSTDSGQWSANQLATTTANYAEAPDGSTTASKITPDATQGYSGVIQATTLTNGKTYTFSAYLRTESGSKTVNLLVLDGDSNFYNGNQSIGDTWQRYTNTFTVTGATGGGGLYITSSLNSTEFLVWGAQLFEGSEAGIYTPTLSTAQTSPVLLPQGLTANKDITGVNAFESARNPYALNLDGASWAEVHDNASLDFGTGSFTLEVWAKFSYVAQGSSFNAILTLGGDTGQSNNGRAALVSLSISKMSFYYNASSHASTSTFSEGDWVHLVGVYDETNAIVYINGAEESTTARAASSITNTDVKMIGRDSISTRYYNDQIALPRIYNRALTATEVARNYNADKSKFGL